ncbi:MAG: 50S ribosomal protein L23 [Candidatus Saccharimonadales bacterium]
MSQSLVLKPRMSEKAYGLTQTRNVYVFDVATDVNKHTVARSVADQFKVSVDKVAIMKVKGKAKRTISKKGRVVLRGSNSDFKKAYVTLKKGDSLPFFEAAEKEAEASEAKQEKMSAAMDKQAAKAAKKDDQPARRGLRLPSRRSGSRGGDK